MNNKINNLPKLEGFKYTGELRTIKKDEWFYDGRNLVPQKAAHSKCEIKFYVLIPVKEIFKINKFYKRFYVSIDFDMWETPTIIYWHSQRTVSIAFFCLEIGFTFAKKQKEEVK